MKTEPLEAVPRARSGRTRSSPFPPAIAVPRLQRKGQRSTPYTPRVPSSLNSASTPLLPSLRASTEPARTRAAGRCGPSTAPCRPSCSSAAMAKASFSAIAISSHSTSDRMGLRDPYLEAPTSITGTMARRTTDSPGLSSTPGSSTIPLSHRFGGGWRSVNTGATDRRAGSPNGSGGITNVAGDTAAAHPFYLYSLTMPETMIHTDTSFS